jgi:preprotein translocase subunit SecG
MNWIGIITTLLTWVNVLICLLLIFVVLLQRPKTEGLGAAFGGDTASNIFGAQTTNVLANLTRWLGGLFLGLCLVIAILGTIDPTRKTAVADFVNQRAAEKKAAEEKKKAEDAAKVNAANIQDPKANATPAQGVNPPSADQGSPLPTAPAAIPPGTPANPSAVTPPAAVPNQPSPIEATTPAPGSPKAGEAPPAAGPTSASPAPAPAPAKAEDAKPAEPTAPSSTPAPPVTPTPAPAPTAVPAATQTPAPSPAPEGPKAQ